MDFVRMSVLPTREEMPMLFEDRKSLVSSSKPTGQDDDLATAYAACANKCQEILPLLVDKKFASKYWTLPIGIPDCYVFSHRSSRCLIIEVVTRFPESQRENLYTYKFATHPLFEEKLNAYTRCKGGDKPNQNLLRSRPWDVALNVVLKIEAVTNPYRKHHYLLKREHQILEYMWENYLEKAMDIDEMTGIPMVFEYAEVPNETFFALAEGHQVDEIDTFGKVRRLKFPPGTNSQSTLTYMTMEKLGPSISYLQQLVKSTQTPPMTFDLWTALKIFDQLLCRILQVHRFSVVHNDVCPENVYMGSNVAFDVVYLNNYKRAYRIADGDKEGPSGLSGSCIGCNIRFASVGQLSGTARLMRPIDDIESAFYMLVAMLNSDALPWDALLRKKRTSEYSMVGQHNSEEEQATEQLTTGGSNAYDDQTMAVGPGRISTETMKKMLEFKQRFWQSNHILNLILSNAACVFTSDESQAANVTGTIREVYFKIKDWRQNFKQGEECHHYCAKLSRPSSEEFRQFMELRKCALIHFKFADIFDLINDITFRKRVAHELQNDAMVQQPWNSLVWCFNNIEIKPETKTGNSGQLRSDINNLIK